MTPRSTLRTHEWLELLDRSGLVVTEVPLQRHFPDGPAPLDPKRYQWLVGRWQRFQVDPGDARRRREWEQFVLHELLAWPSDRVYRGSDVPGNLRIRPDDLDQTLAPSAVVTNEEGAPILAVWSVPAGQHLDRVEKQAGRWRATPQVKLERWMRASRVRVGLLTNGEGFRLVHVPAGLPAGWIEFDAQQWVDDRDTLAGFQLLVGWQRVSGAAKPSLAELLSESETEQTDLTDRLGEQVRQAVEDLLLAWDRADHARGERRLKGIRDEEIYEAAVFVVMRLVFLLFAEERSLLPHGNVFYDEGYGIGRLLHQLQEERRLRPEAFRESADAWPRLLALFRLVFEGCSHPDLVLPTYGGDLFEPRRTSALKALEDRGLRIRNPDVYSILRSLTVREVPVGREKLAQRISYRTLDVEHIGYVYEGLLDHRAARAGTQPMVKLRNGTEEAFSLTEVEERQGADLVDFLASEKTLGGDRERIEAALQAVDPDRVEPLNSLSAAVRERCTAYAGVIQTDEVAEPGHLFMTTAASRRATGTHYTPVQYTRAMVQETLDPLVYQGEHGRLDDPLTLRSPRELLDLKVCDPAMGSGAFLVQTVRFLGEKLTDSWYQRREQHGEDVQLYLPHAEPAADREDRIPLPEEREEAELLARRYVAERCIYGVDKNGLAAEMAKLSVWLVTLSQERPFSFLDHALRVGDSLVGISDLEQLRTWSLDGAGEEKDIFEDLVADEVDRALELRRELVGFAVVEPADVERKARLLADAEEGLRHLCAAADLLLGPRMAADKPAEVKELNESALGTASAYLREPEKMLDRAHDLLGGVKPFHWPLEFPEVYQGGGFHAVVGNPPFMGGKKLRREVGKAYREYLVEHLVSGVRGSADLVAYFFHRAYGILRPGGTLGLLAVNSIAEGDTRQVGLEVLLRGDATIYAAFPDEEWPNDAAVVTTRVHIYRGEWWGSIRIRERSVPRISAYLTAQDEWSPESLMESSGVAFIGSVLSGRGFLLDPVEARNLLAGNPARDQVVLPYLSGRDLNQIPSQLPSRWVICFWDWSLSRASRDQELLGIVKERVKPHRDSVRRKTYRENWWRFAEAVPGLYHAVGRGDAFESHPEDWVADSNPLARVAVTARVTKYWAPSMVPNRYIMSEQCVVFASEDPGFLALLTSSIHREWAWKQGSKLGASTLRYTPTDCFQTFPLPRLSDNRSGVTTARLGADLHGTRRSMMENLEIGLTELHNRLHDPSDRTEGLDLLRQLQVEIDKRVLVLYGWDDLDLAHDFRDLPYLPENDRHRFAISEAARVEVLRRLSELNRERYEEELRAGLHDKKRTRKTRRKRKTGIRKKAEPKPSTTPQPQGSLFEYEPLPSPAFKAAERRIPDSSSDPEEAILTWLRSHSGWHGRNDILDATGVPKSRWRTAINNLLDAGLVRKEGERRGTRYTATEES